jgi:hypothetical protein
MVVPPGIAAPVDPPPPQPAKSAAANPRVNKMFFMPRSMHVADEIALSTTPARFQSIFIKTRGANTPRAPHRCGALGSPSGWNP